MFSDTVRRCSWASVSPIWPSSIGPPTVSTCGMRRLLSWLERRGREYPRDMVIGAIVGGCVLLLILGFLVPRLSRYPQRGVDRATGTGRRGRAEVESELDS